MKELQFGTGKIIISQRYKLDNKKTLLFFDTQTQHKVGGILKNEDIPKLVPEKAQVAISFENIESARLLQDTLNELIAEWSRELSPLISLYETGELTAPNSGDSK